MRSRRRRRPPPGSRPGTLIAPVGSAAPQVRITRYDEGSVAEQSLSAMDDFGEAPAGGVLWIDVQGLGDSELIRRLGQAFGLHPLTEEDVLHCPQRPKFESYPTYDVLLTRQMSLRDGRAVVSEQLSILVGDRWVLTLQEQPGDVLAPVRARIRTAGSRIRGAGAAFLAYAILDAIVDGWFIVLESATDQLEGLERALLTQPRPPELAEISALKSRLTDLRRVVWAQRDAAVRLLREGSARFGDGLAPFLRDVVDHCVQCSEAVSVARDDAAELTGLHLSLTNTRLSEKMSVLTVVAAVFIPLSFLAGLYGMNFDHMPELKWRAGYPVLLTVMAGIATGALTWFRRRGWLAAGRSGG